MKQKFLIPLAISLIFFTSITLHSCRKDFGFKEFENLKTDSFHLSGIVALPLINTELTLEKYLPPNDSSLWAEVDADDLIHLKMYFKDLYTFKMREIFPNETYDLLAGTIVTKDAAIIHSDTSKMKMYDKLLEGKLFFRNPQISFFIENDIPLATFFKIDSLAFYNSEGDWITGDSHVTYPIDAPVVYNETVYDTVRINSTNLPELPDLFSPVPKSISFKFTAGSHTDQTLPFDVTGEESMNIDAEIDLPLDVRLDTILMSDTIPLPENWMENNVEQIKEATLKMFFVNGFPMDAYVQVYFADTLVNGEVGNIIDKIFTNTGNDLGWHLEAADIDEVGYATTPNEAEPMEIVLDQARLHNLVDKHASRIVIDAYINTKNEDSGDYVRIRGKDKIKIRFGIMAKFEGDTNDTP